MLPSDDITTLHASPVSQWGLRKKAL